MQDDFASLFAFNRWANSKMLDACGKLTLEQTPPSRYLAGRLFVRRFTILPL